MSLFNIASLVLVLIVAAVYVSRQRRQAEAPPIAPSPDAATLVVMRDSPVSGKAYFRVDVDGQRVAVLKANRYTVVALRPGAHVLAVNVRVSLASDTVERFTVAPGDTIVYQLNVPFFGQPKLERLTNLAVANEAMGRLKRVDSTVAEI